MASLDELVATFQKELERRLEPIGRRLLDESRDQASFNRQFFEVDEATARHLDELCKLPAHCEDAEGPKRKPQTQDQIDEAVRKAESRWDADAEAGRDEPPFVFSPRDEWENAVWENHPSWLLPNVKLTVRNALEALAKSRREFFRNLANSRYQRSSIVANESSLSEATTFPDQDSSQVQATAPTLQEVMQQIEAWRMSAGDDGGKLTQAAAAERIGLPLRAYSAANSGKPRSKDHYYILRKFAEEITTKATTKPVANLS